MATKNPIKETLEQYMIRNTCIKCGVIQERVGIYEDRLCNKCIKSINKIEEVQK